MSSLPWQPIETCPRVEEVTYLGYDEHTAKLYDDLSAGLCLITWWSEDDHVPAGWHVQPFSDGLDCVYDDETNVKFWCPLTALVPSGALS